MKRKKRQQTVQLQIVSFHCVLAELNHCWFSPVNFWLFLKPGIHCLANVKIYLKVEHLRKNSEQLAYHFNNSQTIFTACAVIKVISQNIKKNKRKILTKLKRFFVLSITIIQFIVIRYKCMKINRYICLRCIVCMTDIF